jgi:hypothetical protein
MTSDPVEPANPHPLGPALLLLRETLCRIGDEATHMMLVTDEHGHVLWREGRHDTRPRSDSGRHPVRIFHAWTCAAAAIHDPEHGRLIGVVDVSAPVPPRHPTTLALVVAAARLAENHLAAQLAARDERLRARYLPRLMRLRDEPGALLTRHGRVLAAQPQGWLSDRIELPDPHEAPSSAPQPAPISLGEHGDAVLEPLPEGWLLRLRGPGSRPTPT